jgi:hypothetical protein
MSEAAAESLDSVRIRIQIHRASRQAPFSRDLTVRVPKDTTSTSILYHLVNAMAQLGLAAFVSATDT